MNEVKTTFGILPGINSNYERVSGTLSVTSYDNVMVFHLEIDVDELLIVEIGDFEFDDKKFNARCGDIQHDYFFNIPANILKYAETSHSSSI